MLATWNQIIEHALTATKRGPYRIPVEELEIAVHKEFKKTAISDPTPIDVLNSALEPHDLRAEFNLMGRFVTVSHRKK